jgi:hypothetical protein
MPRSRIAALVGGRARIGLGAVTLAAAALPAVLAGPAASQEPPPAGPTVLVAATSDHAELIKTIPIAGGPGAAPRVVMSMGPGQLPDLMEGDRLRASAEVQITADCTFQRPRCAGPPYRYSPRLRGRLILADGAQVTGGANAVAIGGPDQNTCRQQTGDREHHCMLVPRGGIDVAGENPPCDVDSCHVNFVVEAWGGNPGAGDVVVVGGQRPNGTILQDKGRINVA